MSIIQGRDVELLFGLDMLKAHQACIDLEKNALRIQGREVKFLAEHELPAKARDSVLLADSNDRTPENSRQRGTTSGSSSNVPNPRRDAALRQPAPSQASGSTAQRWTEKDIETLMGFGVTRDAAIQMLDATNGNVDAAASILFS